MGFFIIFLILVTDSKMEIKLSGIFYIRDSVYRVNCSLFFNIIVPRVLLKSEALYMLHSNFKSMNNFSLLPFYLQ